MRKLLSFLVFLMLASTVCLGQSQNGSVSGVITDTSGALVSRASITVTSLATKAKRATVTTRSGDYTVQGLPPQDYTMTVSAPGFADAIATFNVSVGSANTVSVKLAVQASEAKVDVAANSLSGINLENAENSQVINTTQILELPTQTRNPYDLVALSGSVTVDPSQQTVRGVGGASISGARAASTDILLDGMENTYLYLAGVALPVPLDSVQEFRLITSNFGPEYGRASGGIVNVLTKSGTNALHGSAYEFYRPSTFASDSYYNKANGIPQHRFVRNNYGLAVGGPIKKDKLFFFGNYEGLRIRSSNVVQYYIPTTQFLAASAPATQAFFQQFGTVTAVPTGKILTLGQIGQTPAQSATAVTSAFSTDRTKLEALPGGVFTDSFPVLQQVNVTVPIDAGGGAPQNTYNYLVRLDFNPNEKTQMFGRYVRYSDVGSLGGANNSPYAGYNTINTILGQDIIFGLTHTFSPRLTSTIQFAGLRYNSNSPLGVNPPGPTLYLSTGSFPVGGNQFVFPGYSEGAAGSGIPSGGPQNDIQISPVVTYVRGAHVITAGGQYTYIRDNHTLGAFENATEGLVASGTQGALINLQAGTINYFQANLNPQGEFPCVKDLVTGAYDQTPACTLTTPISQPNFSRSNRYNEGAAFANDAWKATPRLTLDAGLRYELYGTQHNKNPALDSNFYYGTTGSLQDRIRAGKVLRVNDIAPAGVQNPGGRLWNVNYKQFAPRIAFAYDLTGDGKTSLRGGYGISYERNFGQVTFNVSLNPPGAAVVSFTSLDVGGPVPISTGVLGSFSSGPAITKALLPTTLRAVDPRIKPAYNQFYTLSLDRQLTRTTSAKATYTGEHGVHNYSIANYNRSFYGQVYENDPQLYVPSNTLNTNRLNPQYTSINVRGADGNSFYNGLNLALLSSNLFNQGLTITANYTYGHSTDDTSSTLTDGESNLGVAGIAYFDPFNHSLDHGNSDFDTKHRISTSVIWNIPYAQHFGGIKREALDGWEIGTIFAAVTGTPFTEYNCGGVITSVCPRAIFNQPPHYQRTGPPVPTGVPDLYNYITFPAYNSTNYGTHADPKIGAADLPTIINGIDYFGNMSHRNAFRGPGNWNGLNLDVNKNTKLTQKLSLQLRCEVYNLFNHANSYLVLGGTNDVSQYQGALMQKNGYSADQGANRQVQLAGKLIF